MEFRLRNGQTSDSTLIASSQALGILTSGILSQTALAPAHVQADGNPIALYQQLSGFWDGRLFISSIPISTSTLPTDHGRSGWSVLLIRPETATEPANKRYLDNATDLFSIPDLYSDPYILDTDNVPAGTVVACPP